VNTNHSEVNTNHSEVNANYSEVNANHFEVNANYSGLANLAGLNDIAKKIKTNFLTYL
jgi:hypothetical protein